MIAENPLQNLEQAIQPAPHDVGPCRPVPESAQQKRHDQVRVSARAPLAVTAERIEHVIAQPGRQRHVPARPQIGHADGAERAVEIRRKAKPEHHRDADRAHRIAGEVAVGLQRKRRSAEPEVPRTERRAARKHLVDDRREHEVGEAHLQRQPVDEQGEPLAQRRRAPRLFDRALRLEIAVTQDRPRNQVREEGHVEAVIEQAARCRNAPAIDIDHVRQTFERVERDAYRQDDAERDRLEVDAGEPREVDRVVGEELGVLEETEGAKIDRDRRRQDQLAPSLLFHPFHPARGDPVEAGGGNDQQHEERIPRAVEEVARAEQEHLSRPPRAHAPVGDVDQREESQEGKRVERHGGPEVGRLRRRYFRRNTPVPTLACPSRCNIVVADVAASPSRHPSAVVQAYAAVRNPLSFEASPR